MAPQETNPSATSWVLNEGESPEQTPKPAADQRVYQVVWLNVMLYVFYHVSGVYGGYLFFCKAMWKTCAFAFLLYVVCGLGITAGVHRLWAHRAYKARLPLRIVLMLFNTVAFQDSILHWARDHRMHHKYSETDADPHNATRGFFFSHVGWLLVRKHPRLREMASTIDVSDLWADPVLRFQKKYYWLLMPACCFILPAWLPTLWGESLHNGFFVCAMFRYTFVLNATWLVNSAAHKWGHRPYDKNIYPVETKAISVLVFGEGFHNYHHTFPRDYRAAELGDYTFNVATLFLDVMAVLGQAYDMKTISKEVVEQRVKRTGDGSHSLWGWGDRDVKREDQELTTVVNPDKNK